MNKKNACRVYALVVPQPGCPFSPISIQNKDKLSIGAKQLTNTERECKGERQTTDKWANIYINRHFIRQTNILTNQENNKEIMTKSTIEKITFKTVQETDWPLTSLSAVYCMAKKSWATSYSELLYKMIKDFNLAKELFVLK